MPRPAPPPRSAPLQPTARPPPRTHRLEHPPTAWSGMAQAVRPGMGTTTTNLRFVPPISPLRTLISFTPRSAGWTHASRGWSSPTRSWGGGGGWGRSGGGCRNDGLAPRAFRCQRRCAQRSAGRHTAVTVNGLAPPTPAREEWLQANWARAFEAVRHCPMPNRGPLSRHCQYRVSRQHFVSI
jgi:hypothetical protein